jgi:tRNA threonylcarbamoyladenosine biosynthesis protein TsaE
MKEFVFVSEHLSATCRLGTALGKLAAPGLVVGLRGPLGAGKTTFVRAVAQGMQVPDVRIVTSPTFVLIQEYRARLPIYHFDTYRLRSADEFAELGVDEYFDGDGVCLIEWSDRVEALLPADRMDVRFSHMGGDRRAITCACLGTRWMDEFAGWRAMIETSNEVIAPDSG